MFIGHYGPAFVAKAVVRTVPLWVLFIAAQWVDFLWAGLVIAGRREGAASSRISSASRRSISITCPIPTVCRVRCCCRW